MHRLAALALVVLTASAARAGEGVFITIDAGYGLWSKDDFVTRLNKQFNGGGLGTDPISGLSNTSLLTDRQMPDGGIFGLHLGYNIAGHVAFEGNITIRPYDILQDTRGGAGIVGLAAHWYPLQGLLRPQRQFDISFLMGMDYILSGGNGIHDAAGTKLDNTGRGFDGTAMEFGFTAELYPAKWVSFGITPRVYMIDPLRYFVSFDNREKGGAIPLSAGTGGLKFYSISLSMSFHFEPLPE